MQDDVPPFVTVAPEKEPEPSSQKKEGIVLFPFFGVNVDDGEAIASSFLSQRALRDAFGRVTMITNNSIKAMGYEQQLERFPGLMDTDTILEISKELNAAYALTGYIAELGDQSLVIVNIIDVENLQLVAGYYQVYRSLGEINALMPDIAQKLAASALQDTGNLPGLFVPLYSISRDVNGNDAQVLALLLSSLLANSGRYAVLPRAEGVQSVLAEQQREQPVTADRERTRRLGAGRNARYVLSGSVQRLGNANRIAVDIHDIEDGSISDGQEGRYNDLSQGIELVPIMAALLGGVVSAPENFVRIDGGAFLMGSDNGESDERPVHPVTVKSFSISKYEVTQKEWFEVMGTNPSSFKGDDLPVEGISWHDAVEYCNRRSLREGLTPVYHGLGDYITADWNANGYRLPTEAEWEYAAKGGGKDATVFLYSGGNSVGTVAWYSGNSGNTTKPVGTKTPNSLGLYDMSGNVYEWCWDWHGSYPSSAQVDPVGPPSGSTRVLRGGSWGSTGSYVRSTERGGDPPTSRYNYIGFRLVRS